MPRRRRVASGGLAYHVLNHAVGRTTIFRKETDYEAFERVLEQVHQRLPVPILAYCLLSNHWHMVLWPRADGQLSEFLRLLTVTHTQRWHAHYHTAGSGPLYRGRFKSFPIQEDGHLLTVCRYVERNALRAGRAPRAEAWRWGSLWHRIEAKRAVPWLLPMGDWPVAPPRDWALRVNQAQTEQEVKALRLCVQRGTPFGDETWRSLTAGRLALESTLHPRGRPRVRPITNKDSRPL